MNKLTNTALVLAIGLGIGLSGCQKDEKGDAPAKSDPATKGELPGSERAPGEAPEAEKTAAEKPKGDHPEGDHPTYNPAQVARVDETGDYLKVETKHEPTKPGDPVVVVFGGLKVVEAKFDPAKIEGGSATVEFDLTQIDSGVPKRDKHLASADYFDSAKHPKGTILVKDVKAKGEDMFTASAEITVHDVTKTMLVEFKVTKKDETSITIEGTHSFDRNDFGIGKPEGDPVAAQVTAKLKLSITAPK